MPIQQMFLGAAPAADKPYMESVFRSFLYDGTGSEQTIDCGIDLAKHGGLVWIKRIYPGAISHAWYDTNRGVTKKIEVDNNNAETTVAQGVKSFNNTGFVVGTDSQINVNDGEHIAWVFRKHPGWFDIVTYSGNGSAREISHSLGSTPKLMVVKKLGGGSWFCYHIKLGNSKYIKWDDQEAAQSDSNIWNASNPTSSVFKVGDSTNSNQSGQDYVAYLWSDGATLGENEDQKGIKFEEYNGMSGSSFEGIRLSSTAEDSNDHQRTAQWGMIWAHNVSSNCRRFISDNMRGTKRYGESFFMRAEDNQANIKGPSMAFDAGGIYNSDGTGTEAAGLLKQGQSYLTFLIRGQDNLISKTPEAGTEVFSIVDGASNVWDPAFPQNNHRVDGLIKKPYNPAQGGGVWVMASRKNYGHQLYMNLTSSIADHGTDDNRDWQYNTGAYQDEGGSGNPGSLCYQWKLYGGFDTVRYKGNSHGTLDVPHNLGGTPEMLWIKSEETTSDWYVWHSGLDGGSGGNYRLKFTTAAEESRNSISSWSSTNIVVNNNNSSEIKLNNQMFNLWLFRSITGICKCGYYTGDGSSNDSKSVSLGFQPRLLIIKRTNSTGSWLVFDSLRGDGYNMQLESSNTQSSDNYISFTSTGFTLSSSHSDVNANNSNYIYYSHS